MVWWRRAPVSTHSEQRPEVRIPTPPTHNESGPARRKLPRRSALRDWTHEAAGTLPISIHQDVRTEESRNDGLVRADNRHSATARREPRGARLTEPPTLRN